MAVNSDHNRELFLVSHDRYSFSSTPHTSCSRERHGDRFPRIEGLGVEAVGKLGLDHDNLPTTPPPVASSIPAEPGRRPGTKVLLGEGRWLTALSGRDLRLCPARLAAHIMDKYARRLGRGV
jgi:hypothetical protein